MVNRRGINNEQVCGISPSQFTAYARIDPSYNPEIDEPDTITSDATKVTSFMLKETTQIQGGT